MLLPGQEKTLKVSSLKAAAVDVAQMFRAVVDSGLKTAESNEANNQFTRSYLPGRPDFVIGAISFAPDPPLCGRTFAAYVTVRNAGTAVGDAGFLDIWLNEATAPGAGSATHGDKNASVGTLAAGQEKQVKFTSLGTSPSPEERFFRALVNSRARTVETDDTNNGDLRSYQCAPAP